MSSGATDAVVVRRGFQLLSSYRFSHQIRCVAPQGTDSVAVHYTVGLEHITSVCPVKPHGFQRKYTVGDKVLQLLFIKKYRLHVAFCSDLTLRVFSEHFELIQVVHITATVLSMLFIEETATLYTGEVGCIEAWSLRPQFHSPLVRQKGLDAAVKQEQWVVSLDSDACGQMVAVACQDAVFIIDAQTHQQMDVHMNRHVTSITSALLCSQLDYLVTSSKDGSIIIQNTILHCEVHTFTGHIKAVTALQHHNLAHFILSCSLDGTVRVWDLYNLSECYRLDCGEELFGMSYNFRTGSQLICYSRQTVKIWVVSQLESHFTTVNSHVLALDRVEAQGSSKPARIMAKADDGGVRLLCPVSGEVITMLFPLSSSVADNVVYCPIGCLFFALLRTSEVLVLSAHTNPCSAVELWTTQKDRYESICLYLVEWKGKAHSLVFGGQESGYIALLHSPLFTMPHPCPAHAGSVCKLTSQASPDISSENTPSLLSYGSDSFLNIWTVALRESSHHIRLKVLLCVQLESPPRQIGVLGTLICLTTVQNTVKMLDVSPKLVPLETHYLGHGCLFSSMPVLSHQREDSHTSPITSLSCCPSLGLFATSSRDGHVKVWNTSNQLVSDAHFGDTLTTVCFSNTRGDLLVGFQSQVCLVQAHDYLPPAYLELSKKCPLNEQVEEPILFDRNLEFWYSPERVPSLPLHLEERKEQSSLSEFYMEPTGTKDNSGGEYQLSVIASERKASSLCDVVDPHLAKRCSHHYYASLAQSTSTSTEKITDSSLDRDASKIEPVSSLQAAIFSGLGTLEKLEKRGILEQRGRLTWRAQPKNNTTVSAEVAPLQSPSCKFPIAPDCFIPNSIVRRQVGYIPPPEDILQQTHAGFNKQNTHEADSYHSNTRPIAGEVSTAGSLECINSLDIFREDLSFNDFLDSAKSHEEKVFAPDVEEEEEGKEEENKDTKETGEVKEKPPHAPPQQHQQQQHQQQQQGDNGREPVELVGPTSDSHKDRNGSSRRVAQPAPHPAPRRAAEPTVPTQISSTGPTVEARITHSKEAGKSSKQDDSYVQPVETKVIPTVTIPFGQGTSHRDPAQRHTGGQRRPSKTLNTQGGKVDEGLAGECDSKAMVVMRSIMQRQWFPHRLRSCSTEEVCSGLVSFLAVVDMPTFGKVCQALLELKEVSLLTDTQQSAIVDTLTAQLPSAEPSLKATILNSLEHLGVGRDDVVLSLLPFLVDHNVEVKTAAFSALKGVCGVSNRSQLQQLLIRLGLLQHVETNEDEILQDLARRLGRGSWARSGADSRPHPTSRHAGYHETAEQSKLVDSTCAPDKPLHSRGREGKRLKKLKPGSKHEDRVSGKTAITKAKLATQTNTEGTGYRQAASPADEEENRAHEQAGQCEGQEERQYSSPGTVNTRHRTVCPSSLTCTAAQHGTMPLTPITTAKPPAILPLLPGGQSTGVSVVSSHREQPNSGTQQVGQIHRLLAVNPTSFSQTRPAMDLMVRAYDERRKGTRVASDQFIWSEVFPVLRPTESRAGKMRRGRRDRALSYPKTSGNAVTVLPKLVPCSGGEDQQPVPVKAGTSGASTCAVQTTHELKLPNIG